jgi:type II secretory pathway component GspD/PulD (secretin)
MKRSRSAKKTQAGTKCLACGIMLAILIFGGLEAGLAETPELQAPQSFEAGMEKSIFLDLRDINVVDVFKFLAVQGSLNVVTSKNVQGRSTLLLRDVKIKDALDILAISNQLAYETRNNILYIMTEDEYAVTHGKNFNDKKKIAIRMLKTAKPSYALATLQGVQSAIGKVIIDEDTGTIVMIDIPEKLMQMNGILDQVEKNLATKVIKLQFAKADDVAAQLKPQIEGKGVGTVIADSRSNQIILSAYPDRLESAVKLVEALDKQTRAVLIETRILQLTLNPSFEFGIDWSKKFPVNNVNNFKIANVFTNSAITEPTVIDSGTTNFGKFTVGEAGDSFDVKIKAMKEIKSTKVLANPRLMVLDRQEAKINIGDRIPYVVSTTTMPSGGGDPGISQDIRFIDVGLMLVVTPIINDDGFVTMKIRPEISSKVGDIDAYAGVVRGRAGSLEADREISNKIPIVNSTSMESTVIIRDGISAILGGLIRDQLDEDNRGVPYLMDLPVLGYLFKARSEVIKKTELVIIITPHIVTGAKDVLDKPLPIKGQSTGNAISTSFQENAPDMFRTRSFATPGSEPESSLETATLPEGLAAKESRKSVMDGFTSFFQKISPIKKGK